MEENLEVWKDVFEYEGFYKISNLGRIKSLSRKDTLGRKVNEMFLKLTVTKSGYLKVVLNKNKKKQYFLVHRLVALHFLKDDRSKSYVNHINGNKKDNRAINLEWCTPKENSNHAVKLGLIKSGVKNPKSKLTKEEVEFIRDNYKMFDTKYSLNKLAKMFNVSKPTISRCLKNETYSNN